MMTHRRSKIHEVPNPKKKCNNTCLVLKLALNPPSLLQIGQVVKQEMDKQDNYIHKLALPRLLLNPWDCRRTAKSVFRVVDMAEGPQSTN